MAGSKLILGIAICAMVDLSLQVSLAAAHNWWYYRVPVASVGTFNAFLFRGAPGFQERKETLIQTLKNRIRNRSPDVLCLQELIRASDVREIAQAVKRQYPYQASFTDLSESTPSPQPACSLAEITAIGACLQQSSCGNLTGAAFINCTTVECQDLLFQTSVSCRLCSGSENPFVEGDLGAALLRCTTDIPASEYEAPFGLLLLSRYPLTDIAKVDYHKDPVLLPRAYISAKVPTLSQTVLCTHLTAEQDDIDYVGPPQFSSIAEQQADEVKTILDFVEKENQVILLGDFNHGPAIPGLTWTLPFNYGLMTARGLFSVNALWCGQCTFCADENIFAANSETVIIDHIYLPTSRISTVVHVDRLFDAIVTPSGLPLSDHFGVRAALVTRRGSSRVCPGSNVLGKHVNFLALDDVDAQVEAFCNAE